MDIIGKVIQVLPLQEGTSSRTGNPWTIKTFILETLENYPRKVAIEIFGSQRIQDNPCEVDQVVTVSFDLESREFNGRWYTSVRAWRVQQGAVQNSVPASAPLNPQGGAAPAPQPQIPGAMPAAAQPSTPAAAVTQTFDAAASAGVDESTDLPF